MKASSLPSPPSSLRLGAALLATACAVSATACADLGERASTGDCPRFGDCSPDTPQGLSFSSAGFGGFGGGIVPVAIGGRLDLRLTDVATGQPLLRPYRASTRGALAVVAQRGDLVSLRGVSTEGDTLRIDDPGSEELFDQIGVLALPAQSVGIQPNLLFNLSMSFLPQAQRRPIALLAGGGAAVNVELLAADNVRVVDEDLTVALAPSTSLSTTIARGSSWDLATITTAPSTAAPLDLELSAAGQIFPLRLPVVSEPELLEAGASTTPPRVGEGAVVCFNAVAAGRNLLGVSWTFTATGATGEQFLDTGCFATKPLTAAGPIAVTASSGTRTMTVELTVLPAAPFTSSPAPRTALPAPASPSAQLLLALEAAHAAAAAASLGDRAAYSSSPVQ